MPKFQVRQIILTDADSVGDLVVDEAGVAHLVARFGFEEVA